MFCNKESITQLVQKYIAANSRLEEAEAKLERLQEQITEKKNYLKDATVIEKKNE